MGERPSPVFMTSDLSSAALERYHEAPVEFIQHLASNSGAHAFLGVAFAFVCSIAVPQENRRVVGLALLLIVALKDFALDFWTYAREPLVFLDAFWDVATYYFGWWIIEKHGQIASRRAVEAFKKLQGLVGKGE